MRRRARVLALTCLATAGLLVACGARERTPAELAIAHGLAWKPASPAAAVTWAAPDPAGPLTVTAQHSVADLSPSSGFPLDGAWVAASDGAFEVPLELRGGQVEFHLSVKGIKSIDTPWPRVRFLLDGREIASIGLEENAPDRIMTEQFTSPRYRWLDIVAAASPPAGHATLRVEYECRGFDPIERLGFRGVFLDRLVVRERAGTGDACTPAKIRAPEGKVLLIGLDGLSWSIVIPMVNRGGLPNLAALMREGAYGPLDSQPPTVSPVIWSTIQTGTPRKVHGLQQMSLKAPGSYESESHSTRALHAATLWQMAGLGGRSSVVVGMYTSWPAQPTRGVVVSDRSFHEPIAGGVWPPDQSEAVSAALADLEKHSPPVPETVPQILRSSALRDARAVDLLRAYLSTGQPDLATIYLGTTDHVGHLGWREHAPFGLDHRFAIASPGKEAPPGDPVEAVYTYIDGLVGRILGGVDRSRTTVIVVSDHSCDMADALTQQRYKFGDLVKQVSGGKAYAPFDESWIVMQMYLNLRGREPEGTVDPADRDAVAAALADQLRLLRTESGEKIFEDVSVMPAVTVGPMDYQPADLTGIVNARLSRGDRVLMPGAEPIPVSDFVHLQASRTGTHDRFGALILSGPGARGGALIHSSSILDVVPTALALLGLPGASDLPGRPISEGLAPEIASPCVIPGYYGLVTPAPDPGAGGQSALSPEELEKLRALGYVQ